MKKQLSLLALAASLAAPTFASEGVVLGIDAGNTKADSISGTTYGVYTGYRFTESLALEVGYRRLFKDTVREQGVNVDVTGTALQASLVAYLPINSDVSLFGRFGYNQLKAKASAGGFSASDKDSKALFGLGVEYAFSASTALRVEFQKPASDTRSLTAGVKFSF